MYATHELTLKIFAVIDKKVLPSVFKKVYIFELNKHNLNELNGLNNRK